MKRWAAAFRGPVRPREFVPDLDRQIEAVLALAMALTRGTRNAIGLRIFFQAADGTLDAGLYEKRQIPA